VRNVLEFGQLAVANFMRDLSRLRVAVIVDPGRLKLA
jgi:hypothetical protein